MFLTLLLNLEQARQVTQQSDTSLLILIACGFAALLYILNQQKIQQANQQQQQNNVGGAAAAVAAAPNADVRALQESVRMLLEAQSQQQQRRPSDRYAQQHPQQQQQQHIPLSFSHSSDRDSPEPIGSFSSSSSVPPLKKQPSFSLQTTSPNLSSASVPFELIQDMKQLQDSIKNLERKNRELNRQLTLTEVSNVVDLERKYRLPVPVSTEDSSHTLNLSASEIETIRAIFNMFDTEQSGYISTKELQSLHKQLGEPLTDEEARNAVSELDQEGTGTVNFNKFLIWWYHTHSQGRKGSAYTQRFKLMHAKLTAGNFDIEKVITQDSGEPYTLEYRLNFYYKGHNQSLKQISPWHDIPLNRIGSGEQGQLFNFICEIPKWTRAKFECATGELYNPIKQDTQHGKLRYYKHGDMMFNYGFFPQTWEDPDIIPLDTGYAGDNDPIDCVEIGATQFRVGAIQSVKILGLLGLIDDGETDWKIIAIAISDPMAHLLNDIDDVEVHLPGAIKAIREYFRDYKSFSGKINTYALRAQAMPRHYAVKVLEETHQHWKALQAKKRYVIGESQHQSEGRKESGPNAIVPAPTGASASSSTSSAPASSVTSPRGIFAGSPKPKSLVSPSPKPAIPAAIKDPEWTGMEQPLDKYTTMQGK